MKWSHLITAGVLALAVCGGDPVVPEPEEEEEEEDPTPSVTTVIGLEVRSQLS